MIFMVSMNFHGLHPNPHDPGSKVRAGGGAAPKHRVPIRYGAPKHRTERVFGAVGFELAKKHVPGSAQGATLVPPGHPPGARYVGAP